MYHFKGIEIEYRELKERKFDIRHIEYIKQPNEDSCGIACVISTVESIKKSEDKQLRDLMENRRNEYVVRSSNNKILRGEDALYLTMLLSEKIGDEYKITVYAGDAIDVYKGGYFRNGKELTLDDYRSILAYLSKKEVEVINGSLTINNAYEAIKYRSDYILATIKNHWIVFAGYIEEIMEGNSVNKLIYTMDPLSDMKPDINDENYMNFLRLNLTSRMINNPLMSKSDFDAIVLTKRR
jgi:hypothetical protein